MHGRSALIWQLSKIKEEEEEEEEETDKVLKKIYINPRFLRRCEQEWPGGIVCVLHGQLLLLYDSCTSKR